MRGSVIIVRDWIAGLTTVRVPEKVQQALKRLDVASRGPKKPAHLPRNPPLPEGYTAWVYRGMGWHTELPVTLAFCEKGDKQWETTHERAVGYRHYYYMEAVQ